MASALGVGQEGPLTQARHAAGTVESRFLLPLESVSIWTGVWLPDDGLPVDEPCWKMELGDVPAEPLVDEVSGWAD